MKPQYDDSKDFRFQFFQRNRRKITLEGIAAQMNGKQDDRKIVFKCCLPITGQKLTGLPAFLKPAFEAIEKEGSLVSEAPLGDFKLEGMTVEYFPQEDSDKASRIGLVTNKTLYDFVVNRQKEGDCEITVLHFKYRTKESIGAYGFWCKHGGNAIWADFTPTEGALKEADDRQMSLVESNSGQKVEEPEEEQSALAETA